MTWIQKGSKKPLWFTLYLLAILISLSIFFVSKSNANDELDNREVALIIHNWQDRPIFNSSVNGIWGGYRLILSIHIAMVWAQQHVAASLKEK